MSAANWFYGAFIGLLAWWVWWRIMENNTFNGRALIGAIAFLFLGASLQPFVNDKISAGISGFLGLAMLVLLIAWPKLRPVIGDRLMTSVGNLGSDARIWLGLLLLVWLYGTVSSVFLLIQRNDLEKVVREDIVPIRNALERWVIPRHLSEEQKETIGNYLSKFRSYKAAFTVPTRDAEAESYRNDIQEALVSGGWTISGKTHLDDVEEGLTYDFVQTPATFHRDDNDPRNPKQNKLFSDALAKAKVDIIGGSDHQTKDGEEEILIIHIGHRKRDRRSSLEFWPY